MDHIQKQLNTYNRQMYSNLDKLPLFLNSTLKIQYQ